MEYFVAGDSLVIKISFCVLEGIFHHHLQASVFLIFSVVDILVEEKAIVKSVTLL